MRNRRFCDLAQPDPQIAVPTEPVNGAHGFEEGLAGELLRKLLTAGKLPYIMIDRLKIGGIDLLKFHCAASLL